MRNLKDKILIETLTMYFEIFYTGSARNLEAKSQRSLSPMTLWFFRYQYFRKRLTAQRANQ